MQDQILAKVGVDGRHLALLNSWVHCDQFIASHETSHLLALQDLLRAQASAATSDSSEMSLADHAHSCRLAKKLGVSSGIGAKLRPLADDSFQSLSATQLPIVLDILKSCSSTTKDVHELLHEVVNRSTERELARMWNEEPANLNNGSVAVLDSDQLHSRLDTVEVCKVRLRCGNVHTACRVVRQTNCA